MMNKVDIKQWERREAYEFFADYEMPYIQITTRLDLRNLVVLIKEMNLSFYGVMTYMVLVALNEIEAFHFGIVNDEVVKFQTLGCSFTTMDSNHSVCFSRKIGIMPFLNFMEAFENAKNEAESHKKAKTPMLDDMGMVYISCLPWIDIESVTQPIKSKYKDVTPRVLWGKYTLNSDGGHQIPINLHVHHAFQDGWHMALFFQLLQEKVYKMCNNLTCNSGLI